MCYSLINIGLIRARCMPYYYCRYHRVVTRGTKHLTRIEALFLLLRPHRSTLIYIALQRFATRSTTTTYYGNDTASDRFRSATHRALSPATAPGWMVKASRSAGAHNARGVPKYSFETHRGITTNVERMYAPNRHHIDHCTCTPLNPSNNRA